MLNKTKFLKIFILIILIVLIIIAGFYIVQEFKNKELKEQGILISKPWIEVVSTYVFKKDPQTKEIISELKSGDELNSGDFIETNENGLANIYFTDGSVIRLDKNTSLIIEESSFNPQTRSLRVKIGLKLGRVWSRVIQLITADSFWEVKTSNVVATVRGTAFVVEHQKEKSSLWVMAGKIETKALNPETKKEIEETKTIVKEDEILEIKKEDIEKLKEEPRRLIVKEIPKEILENDWVKQNKEADNQLLERVEKIRQELKDEKKEFKEEELEKKEELEKRVRIKLKEEVIEKIKGPIEFQEIKPEIKSIEPKEELKIKELPKELPEFKKINKRKLELPIIDELSKEAESKIQPIPRPKDLKVVISTEKDIFNEGDIFSLKALLIMDDSSQKDVTRECQWQILGKIGTMEFPGSFRARLDSSVSELGEAPGQIICAWTDPETGQAFLGSTAIIKVRAKIEFETETRG